MVNQVDLENINSDKSWDKATIYGRTKLFNIYFTFELHRRLAMMGLSHIITTNCLHPGAIQTELLRHVQKQKIYNFFITFIVMFFRVSIYLYFIQALIPPRFLFANWVKLFNL